MQTPRRGAPRALPGAKTLAVALGADRGVFHAGTLEIPVALVQSVGDAVILNVPTLQLRQVLPNASTPPADPTPESRL